MAMLPALHTADVELADVDVAAHLPGGTTVVSPYQLAETAESLDLTRSTGRPLSAALLHGWLTAKALGVAMWQSEARDAPALRAALERLAGFDSHFSPPYRFRPGTHSLTPEGMLYVAGDGRLSPRSGFRTDPHP